MVRTAVILALLLSLCPPALAASADRLSRAPDATFDLKGHVGDQVRAVTQNWLLRMPGDNPAMLAMFAERDRQPYRDLLPWSGEFAGKYLTGAAQVLRFTGDRDAAKAPRAVRPQALALQADDGYLGPFPKDIRLTGKAPNVSGGGRPGTPGAITTLCSAC